ncbi:MAG: hypothetical protein JJT94_02430 [Bernardetiaceae bacterium]|nr:hypothetical protein [Bernardetiaceae bacterium]
MRQIRKYLLVLLAVLFVSVTISSCVYAPKQPWTPKHKSHTKARDKK